MTMTLLKNIILSFHLGLSDGFFLDWGNTFGGRNITKVMLCSSQFIISRRYMMLMWFITADVNFYTYILEYHNPSFLFPSIPEHLSLAEFKNKNPPKRNRLNFTDLFGCSFHYIRPHTTTKDSRGTLVILSFTFGKTKLIRSQRF